ncbi:nucleoside phosphorylase [Desulfatiglans anilini]|uniref:nucleoside phosphorylase n=1 Tax=Desulfatiglans anilini TaxID=90728 RepID=UPI00040A85E8|nr:nucleoside phosphorylase [Desulfatiglans anilini]
MEQSLQEGIIRPHRGRGEPSIPADVLMVMPPFELRHLARRISAEPVAFADSDLFRLYLPKEGPLGACALSGPFLGAPHAVMGLEKLIALGAQRIWAFGWCGSLSAAARIGDLLIPTRAYPEEGTSRHYPLDGLDLVPDAGLTAGLQKGLESAGLPYRRGAVWTTDAPYRETPVKVRYWQEQGALAVEMEASALMAVSLFRGVRMCALFVVSDELFECRWRPGFRDPLLKKRSRAAAEALLDFVISVAKDQGRRPRGSRPGDGLEHLSGEAVDCE